MKLNHKLTLAIFGVIATILGGIFFEKTRYHVTISQKTECLSEIANSFQFPIGTNGLKGYYNVQFFGENHHLGEDWNGVGGGNTDLGDPVYAIANGMVTYSTHLLLGWGRVVRICHRINNDGTIHYIESIYAHLDSMEVEVGDTVSKGEKIGTIGTANGRYWAHLHFEMRDGLGQDLGAGYSEDTTGYLNPTEFIVTYK